MKRLPTNHTLYRIIYQEQHSVQATQARLEQQLHQQNVL